MLFGKFDSFKIEEPREPLKMVRNRIRKMPQDLYIERFIL